MVNRQTHPHSRGRHADRPGLVTKKDAAASRVPAENAAAWAQPLHDYDWRGDPPGGVTLRGGQPVRAVPCDVTRRTDLDPAEGGRAWQVTPRGFAPPGAELRYVYLAPGDVLIYGGRLPAPGDEPDDVVADLVADGVAGHAPDPPAAAVTLAVTAPAGPETGPETEPEPPHVPEPEPGPAAEPEPETEPAPETEPPEPPAPPAEPEPSGVHRACGYRFGTIGHQITCEDA
jgi:hypothetical protein